MLLVILLGGFGFSAIGTLFSTLAINTKLREVILPVIVFPIILPVIINSIKATTVIINGGGFYEILTYTKILVCFDIIFLVSSALVYEFVIEES